MVEHNRQRDSWLDLTRFCAISLVVLCHATETYYRPVLLGKKRIDFLPWLVENLLFTMGRLGVPLFLAISGALLLSRTVDAKKFYKKSLLPLAVTTEIWIFLNYIFVCIFQGKTFNIVELVKEILFLKESSLSHMWYMPMILGVYVAIPFLAKLFSVCSDISEFALIYLLGVLFFIIFPTLNTLGKQAITTLPTFSSELNKSFWGGAYGLYLTGGYFIVNRKCLERVKTWKLCFIAVVAFVLNSIAQFYLYTNHYFKTNWLYWYTNVAIFLLGLILFEVFRRTFSGKKMKGCKLLETLSRCSFGIYLVHKPIQVLAAKYLPLEGMNTLLKIGILFILGFGGSFIVVYLVWRWSKKAGKILFFVK